MDLNDEDRMLTAALRALAEDDARATAPASVEDRLRAEVRSIGGRRRMRTTALAVAAVLVVAAAIPAWRMATGSGTTGRVTLAPAAPPLTAEVATAFLPLTYSNVPITNGQLVRLAVPRAALASFGLAPVELIESPSSDTVMADVIVGEDGLARAIRFVRPAGRRAP